MNKKKCMILALAVLPMLNSCSDWLDPKPLSFYSPENTYVDAAGLYAALTACERNMRHEFFGDGAPILTEMYLKNMIMMNLRIQSRLNRRIILTRRMRFRQLRTLFLIMNLKAANSLVLPNF